MFDALKSDMVKLFNRNTESGPICPCSSHMRAMLIAKYIDNQIENCKPIKWIQVRGFRT